MSSTPDRVLRRGDVRELASRQAGLVARSQVLALGVTPSHLRAEVVAERWVPIGRRSLVVRPPDPPDRADWWLAVLECAPQAVRGGAPRAALGGITALQAAGLEGVTDDGFIHVCAPKSSHPRSTGPGVRLHETRRWRDEDIIGSGIPRARPDVAAVQAALWARTDREAALHLVTSIQQRLTGADAVRDVLATVQRDKRRSFLRTVIQDVTDGVRSLNELDFAAMCRRRGLPEPDRQVVVRHNGGRAYLDVRWRRWRVVVEIDGIGHLRPDRWMDDSLRHNEIALSGDVVLRVPSLGLRLDPERHLELVERALRRAGWAPAP
jgi:very-short-patch-repair endonuclease